MGRAGGTGCCKPKRETAKRALFTLVSEYVFNTLIQRDSAMKLALRFVLSRYFRTFASRNLSPSHFFCVSFKRVSGSR